MINKQNIYGILKLYRKFFFLNIFYNYVLQ